jgi:AraC-like DNA-binding protein
MSFNSITYSLPLAFNVIDRCATNDLSLGIGRISHSSKTFITDETLPPIRAEEFLGLHFNLGTRLHYKVDDRSDIIRAHQYNLVYVPPMDCECSVEQGHYESFRIHFSTEYLKPLAEHFPILQELLEKAASHSLYTATDKRLYCTKELLQKIKYILYNQFTGVQREVYVNGKVLDILLDSLKAITHSRSMVANNQVVHKNSEVFKKTEAAHKYLEEHFKEHFSPDLVAYAVDIDTYKLRKNFKRIYKISMLDFVLEQRIKKATTLLRETKMTIGKIAAAVGYKKASHFAEIFKRKCGSHPSVWRKENFGSSAEKKEGV